MTAITVFVPADPPRAGSVLVLDPAGDGEPVRALVPEPVDLPATRLSIGQALPVLLTARHQVDAHPSAAFWGAAAHAALRLVAAGRVLPGITESDVDTWRAGPLDEDASAHLAALAAAMPPSARCVPEPESGLLPGGAGLLRSFVDAVADSLPRSPAAVRATGARPFAAIRPCRLPQLRAWSDELSGRLDSGVRISLRIETPDPAKPGFVAVVQVHSVADPTVLCDAEALWDGSERWFAGRARIDTVRAVRRAATVWPALEPLLHQEVPGRLDLGDDDVQDLLGTGVHALAGSGVRVHWPAELAGGLTSRLAIGGSSAPPLLAGGSVAAAWRIDLRGSALTPAELDRLAEAQRPVVRLRDRWVLVDSETAARAKATAPPMTAIEAVAAAVTGETVVDGTRVAVATTGWLERIRRALTEPAPDLAPPDELNAELREYQKDGLRWLAGITALGLGGCLADDMGLGKTITVIALHLHRRPGPTLVVCPASLLGNWEREIRRFAPGVMVRRFHGVSRALDGAGGFVLTTYGTVRADPGPLAAHPWDLVVADEAQHVKNPSSGTARALRTIPAAARIALTGTPVENSLTDLWSILDWTTPGLLGSRAQFCSRWVKPVESDRDVAAAATLARLVRPFLLRRTKSDPGVAPELPAKTETDRPVALTAEQTGLYQAVVRELMSSIPDAEAMARRGLVVKLLTALKQVCNHPAQYLRQDGPLAGRSGKLALLDELLDTILAENGAVLVFTQYVTMGRLLARHLGDRGVRTQLLHGGTPVPRREDMVAAFQRGDVPVFLLSLKAAGTGLNLTRADHVVHYDRWWNPSVEQQATDRAYRIGQTRPVQVHRLIAEGTVEDRIAAMLGAKRELADAVLAAGDMAFTELTDNELAELVRLREAR